MFELSTALMYDTATSTSGDEGGTYLQNVMKNTALPLSVTNQKELFLFTYLLHGAESFLRS
jgi:hypothetical protein